MAKSKPAVKSKVKISKAAAKYLQQSNPTGLQEGHRRTRRAPEERRTRARDAGEARHKEASCHEVAAGSAGPLHWAGAHLPDAPGGDTRRRRLKCYARRDFGPPWGGPCGCGSIRILE